MWLRYQNSGSGPETAFFRTGKLIPSSMTEGTIVTSLRARKIKSVTGTFGTWQITVGMNVLYLPVKKTFIDAWWEADRTWIHEAAAETEEVPADGWIEVVTPIGPIPYSYPTGSKRLPSFAAEVTAAEGVQ